MDIFFILTLSILIIASIMVNLYLKICFKNKFKFHNYRVLTEDSYSRIEICKHCWKKNTIYFDQGWD